MFPPSAIRCCSHEGGLSDTAYKTAALWQATVPLAQEAALEAKDHANEAMDTQFGRGRVARMPNSVCLRGLRA